MSVGRGEVLVNKGWAGAFRFKLAGFVAVLPGDTVSDFSSGWVATSSGRAAGAGCKINFSILTGPLGDLLNFLELVRD